MCLSTSPKPLSILRGPALLSPPVKTGLAWPLYWSATSPDLFLQAVWMHSTTLPFDQFCSDLSPGVPVTDIVLCCVFRHGSLTLISPFRYLINCSPAEDYSLSLECLSKAWNLAVVVFLCDSWLPRWQCLRGRDLHSCWQSSGCLILYCTGQQVYLQMETEGSWSSDKDAAALPSPSPGPDAKAIDSCLIIGLGK
ncbi:hypothetical protein HispidOSU_010326 [Sigmodon hispidus]